MKKWIGLAAAAVFALLVLQGVRISAAEWYVKDDANLFSDAGKQEIQAQAQALCEKYDLPVLLVTADWSGYSDNQARDYIEQTGEQQFPQGYIGMAVNMADRSYWIDAYGKRARAVFGQSWLDMVSEKAADYLGNGDFAGSFSMFLDEAEKRMEIKDTSMGFLKIPLIYPYQTLIVLGISGIVSFVLSGIWTARRAAGHRDRKTAVHADGYASGLHLTKETGTLVGHYQTRVERIEEQHSSGSGSSGAGSGHSGSGGHF